MASYERRTAYAPEEVWRIADRFLRAQVRLDERHRDPHRVVYAGPEGEVEIEAHRHGLFTVVVARTDQLRTSRLDEAVRAFLGQLPYQPGDRPIPL